MEPRRHRRSHEISEQPNLPTAPDRQHNPPIRASSSRSGSGASTSPHPPQATQQTPTKTPEPAPALAHLRITSPQHPDASKEPNTSSVALSVIRLGDEASMEWSPPKTSGHKRGHRDDSNSPVSESAINIVQDLNVLPVESEKLAQAISTPTSPQAQIPLDFCLGDDHVPPTPVELLSEEEEVESLQTTEKSPRSQAINPAALTAEEQALIFNLPDPPRQFEWKMRCPTGHNSTYSAPVRLSDREGRTKLLKGRTRAAPYQNGVFRFRMGTAQKQSPITRSGTSVTPICYSPRSPRSALSLPFPP